MRDGARELFLTGTSNTYTGLLRVEAADGIQNIHLAVNAPLNVTGTVIVNTRDASDAVIADQVVSISEAFLLRSVNSFVNNHGVSVGGDMNVITLLES